MNTPLLDSLQKEAIWASQLFPKKIPGMKLVRKALAKWYRAMGNAGSVPPHLSYALMGAGLGAGAAGTLAGKKDKVKKMLAGALIGGSLGLTGGAAFGNQQSSKATVDFVRKSILRNAEFIPIGLALTPTPIPAGLVLPAYLGLKRGAKMALKSPVGSKIIGGLLGAGIATPEAIKRFKKDQDAAGIGLLAGGATAGVLGATGLPRLIPR